MYYIIRQAKKKARYREKERERERERDRGREGEKESEIFNLLLVKLGKPRALKKQREKPMNIIIVYALGGGPLALLIGRLCVDTYYVYSNICI